MATLKRRRSENVEGNFYVDSTCIDCDTCRWLAPHTFKRQGKQSAVYQQPTDSKTRSEAMQALLACPTASIGTVEKPRDIKKIQATFPLLIADNVYHCGYHSAKSYGATSYFIQATDGNILIDSPRFTPPLIKQLEAKGGIKYLYLTHRDDVADHAKFQQHFSCQRILHQADINSQTEEVEIKLQGKEAITLTEDILIIPVPGHSPGHTALLYKNKFLFTGDHLAWSDYLGHLHGFERYCSYSWQEQINSFKKLIEYDFEWILPGHGRRYHDTVEGVKAQIKKYLELLLSD